MESNWEEAFQGRKVLVTGHTGFKGSWLSLWLYRLGAEVTGYSMEPPTRPSLFEGADLGSRLTDLRGDIRDFSQLEACLEKCAPEVIFHLAAQPIVLDSYELPMDTFAVNAQGTVNLLEAARKSPSVKAVVVVTTDKCYENHSWPWGYRENDRLGGKDPYSASKAMAELAAKSYRDSFGMRVATARSGNVIGGGDYAPFRILPDAVRALQKKEAIMVRNPESCRPWMHVLDPLCGYLMLAAELLSGRQEFAEAWNFGPSDILSVPVKQIVEKVVECWGFGEWKEAEGSTSGVEMPALRLNWEKAAHRLGWAPRYDWEQAVAETVEWYARSSREECFALCSEQIERYTTQVSCRSTSYSREQYPLPKAHS